MRLSPSRVNLGAGSAELCSAQLVVRSLKQLQLMVRSRLAWPTRHAAQSLRSLQELIHCDIQPYAHLADSEARL